MHETDSLLLEPYDYLCAVPGKDVRGMLIDCFQKYLHIPTDRLEVIKSVISSLHNASLLIDDIEDSSRLRRGVPVAHAVYGVPYTINCANYVYFLALEKCLSLKNDRAVHVFTSELLRLHRGQGHDILWRDRGICPTEAEYEAMVLDKTGGLFRLAVGLMQAFSEKTTDFNPLLDMLGLYFQIRDDYVNLSSAAYMASKTKYEDISEGKYSFPIIHAVNFKPKDHRLISILRQRTEDEALKQHAVDWLRQCGSLSYTRLKLKSLYVDILKSINVIGGAGSDDLAGLMKKLESELGDLGEEGGAGSSENHRISTL